MKSRYTALLVAALVLAQPCTAAKPALASDVPQRAAFGAFYISLPFGPHNQTGPKAGLRMGASTIYSALGTGTRTRAELALVDLSFSRTGLRSLDLGGRQLMDSRGRLSLDGRRELRDGASPLLIVGGLVVAAGVGALIWYDSKTCSREESRRNECERA